MTSKLSTSVFAFLSLIAFIALFFWVGASEVLAHESAEEELLFGVSTHDLENLIRVLSVRVAILAGGIIALLTLFVLLIKEPSEKLKRWVFALFGATAILPTLFFLGSTIYLNVISETKGPVHWHADYQIFACGEEVRPKSPVGRLNNKVGTPTFHHHDDNRIHVEGVVVKSSDFELGDFFEVIGGELTDHSLTFPTNEGILSYVNGDRCDDGSSGVWNVFIHALDANDETLVVQKKLSPTEAQHHLMAPFSTIPPGECIILEFGDPQERTDRMCNFYQVEIDKGNLRIQ